MAWAEATMHGANLLIWGSVSYSSMLWHAARGVRIRASDLPITGQPASPPKPQPAPLSDIVVGRTLSERKLCQYKLTHCHPCNTVTLLILRYLVKCIVIFPLILAFKFFLGHFKISRYIWCIATQPKNYLKAILPIPTSTLRNFLNQGTNGNGTCLNEIITILKELCLSHLIQVKLDGSCEDVPLLVVSPAHSWLWILWIIWTIFCMVMLNAGIIIIIYFFCFWYKPES